MANIIYGVSGEGSGHASRARLVIKHLQSKGHVVTVLTYDRGYINLVDEFDVIKIIGLNIVSKDNKISKFKTFSENLKRLPEGKKTYRQLKKLFEQQLPDVVITDFEPCSAYLANYFKVPLVSLDNQHSMRYMRYKKPKRMQKDSKISEGLIRAIVPKPWFSLITTFHFGELKNNHSALFAPILKPSILSAVASEEKNAKILVYITAGFDSLLTTLKQFKRESFVIYGTQENKIEDNLEFKAFSSDGFVNDLAASKAVIATAGFSLISEALHLGKPYLAFPMQGQFEQVLNALHLQEQGYGVSCKKPTENAIASFLYHLPDYRAALETYPRLGNQSICDQLDLLLANDLDNLMQYSR